MNAFASLDKLLDPARPCFTAETAANILQIEPDAERITRMEELAAKANEGNSLAKKKRNIAVSSPPEK